MTTIEQLQRALHDDEGYDAVSVEGVRSRAGRIRRRRRTGSMAAAALAVVGLLTVPISDLGGTERRVEPAETTSAPSVQARTPGATVLRSARSVDGSPVWFEQGPDGVRYFCDSVCVEVAPDQDEAVFARTGSYVSGTLPPQVVRMRLKGADEDAVLFRHGDLLAFTWRGRADQGDSPVLDALDGEGRLVPLQRVVPVPVPGTALATARGLPRGAAAWIDSTMLHVVTGYDGTWDVQDAGGSALQRGVAFLGAKSGVGSWVAYGARRGRLSGVVLDVGGTQRPIPVTFEPTTGYSFWAVSDVDDRPMPKGVIRVYDKTGAQAQELILRGGL